MSMCHQKQNTRIRPLIRKLIMPLTLSLGLSACVTANTEKNQEIKSEVQQLTSVQKTVMSETTLARHDFPYVSHYVDVKGAKMHYVDTGGEKEVVLMIHGQPTWSYLWRDIIPELQQNHRVIALDLIGFGKSDKPDIDYTLKDHAAYLRAFIDALALDNMTLVIHDWGSFLGFDYAAEFPDKVKALAFMESILPFGEPEPEGSANRKIMDGFYDIVKQINTPGVGEKMILEDNFFIEKILLSSPNLSEDEKNAYREPFTKGKNRLPMLQFPRQIGLGERQAEYVVNGIKRYHDYLTTTDIPKLLLTFTPGALIGPERVKWAQNNLSNLQVNHIGDGVHYVQEDHPNAIGQAIATWLEN